MRLENWIEQLVEEPFVRLFSGRLLPHTVARHIARALEDGERVGADGMPEAPGRYRVALHPEDLAALTRHHPDFDLRLAEALETLTKRIAFRLTEPPIIYLQADAGLPLHAVRITPADRLPRTEERTRDFDLAPATLFAPDEADCVRAYLVIQGQRTFDLIAPMVTVGRALDNDLIIEDPGISRYHAQLRRRYGRYILQDMGSSSGTLVNGFPIQEIVLRPGDLISLSDAELLYAEDAPGRRGRGGGTQPLQPPEAPLG